MIRKRLISSCAAMLLLCCAARSAHAVAQTPDEKSWRVDLWPLFQHGPQSTTVLYPFFVHEGNFLMIFPFYYRTNDGHDQHFVWPLVKLSDGQLTRLAPFWFKGQGGDYTFFPFITQTPESTFWFLPPIYMKRDGSFKAVFPFWAKTDHSWFVFPDVYHRKTSDQSKTMMWPFFSHATDANEKSDSLWVIPYSHYTSPRWKSQSVLPLWYWGSNPTEPKSYTHYLPLYLHRERPREHRLAFFPLFGYTREDYDYPAREAAPDVPSAHEKMTRLNVLWPLYHRKEVTDDNGKVYTQERRFLIFSDTLNAKGRRSFSLLGIPIAEHE